MFSRIAPIMTPVNGDENAVPSNLESSSSESSTETLKRGPFTLCVISFSRKQQEEASSETSNFK